MQFSPFSIRENESIITIKKFNMKTFLIIILLGVGWSLTAQTSSVRTDPVIKTLIPHLNKCPFLLEKMSQ